MPLGFAAVLGSALDSADELGQGQLGNAQVSWTFQPGQLDAPLDDCCAKARLPLGGAVQDTTGAGWRTGAAGGLRRRR